MYHKEKTPEEIYLEFFGKETLSKTLELEDSQYPEKYHCNYEGSFFHQTKPNSDKEPRKCSTSRKILTKKKNYI